MNEGRLQRNYVLAALRSFGAQIHLDVRYKPLTTALFFGSLQAVLCAPLYSLRLAFAHDSA